MKISTGWLKQHLCRTITDERLIQALEQAGIEVEHYSSSKPINKNIVIGLVQKVVQHPDADRLYLVKVTTGGESRDIVCGATNLSEGIRVAVALPGSVLPSGDIIKQSKLRGQVSDGMLCSARELGLGDDHDGILIIDGEPSLGQSLCDIYPSDGIVDIKSPANRPDLLSVFGVAREIAAMSGNELLPMVNPVTGTRDEAIINSETEPSRLARFMLASFTVPTDHVDQKTWNELKRNLLSSGIRSISPLVDATNAVMLEYGQPLHAYDADKVTLPVGARLARDGETLVTLDGVARSLTVDDLVIVDASGIIGIAGVMGGQATQVTSLTTNVYLEAAIFGAPGIRKTAQRLGLRSEASSRYERGLPVQLAPFGMARAIELLTNLTGATFDEPVADYLAVWPWTQRIGLRRSEFASRAGYDLDRSEMSSAMGKLQIESTPFDIVAEARRHLGKPYLWGASFKQNGADAFDCGYLIDYLYSLIGQMIGHSAPQLMRSGREVPMDQLRIGDTLYRDGVWKEVKREERDGVSHVALYIGEGKILHAENYHLVDGQWQELPKQQQKVRLDDLAVITEAPGFYGARRHVENLDDFVSVPAVPWWRPDLRLPVDLIEEIVRTNGYDRVPATIPPWRPLKLAFDRTQRPQTRLKNLLSGAGLFEVMTYSFVGSSQLKAAGLAPDSHLKLQNPLSSEQEYLRASLLPSHLSVLARNAGYGASVGFYEISKVFVPAEDPATQPAEPVRLGITLLRDQQAYAAAKGLLDMLGSEFNVAFKVEPTEAAPAFASGRTARIKLGRKVVGSIGQLNPETLSGLKVRGEAAHLELDVTSLVTAAQPTTYQGLQKFPGTSRDITLALPYAVTWSRIQAAVSGMKNVRVSYVGEFPSPSLPGERKVTIHLALAYPDRTPTEAEAERLEAQAITLIGRLDDKVSNANSGS